MSLTDKFNSIIDDSGEINPTSLALEINAKLIIQAVQYEILSYTDNEYKFNNSKLGFEGYGKIQRLLRLQEIAISSYRMLVDTQGLEEIPLDELNEGRIENV